MAKYDAEVASVVDSNRDVNQTFGQQDDTQSVRFSDTESRMTAMQITQMNWVKNQKIQQDQMNKEVNFDGESFRMPNHESQSSQS